MKEKEKKKVLIVGEDEFGQNLVGLICDTLQLHYLRAKSTQKAREILTSEDICLIILGRHLEDGNCDEILKFAKENFPLIKIIYFSSHPCELARKLANSYLSRMVKGIADLQTEVEKLIT